MSITGQTQLVGVMGWPVAHSLSPVMHNTAFEALGLNWCYVPLPVRPEQVTQAVCGLAALGFRGANVTIPHKVEAIPLMTTVSEEVKLVGALNTITVDAETGALDGHNTDLIGFMDDLSANGIVVGKQTRAVILGAGGAARAATAGLARAGAMVTLVNRTWSRAEEIISSLRPMLPNSHLMALPLNGLEKVVSTTTLIVNTTPLGQWPSVEDSPWPAGLPFPKGAALYDMVYRPQQTRLLREAEQAGLHVVGGIGMLIRQGAASFERWTGQPPPVDLMREACLRVLQSRS